MSGEKCHSVWAVAFLCIPVQDKSANSLHPQRSGQLLDLSARLLKITAVEGGFGTAHGSPPYGCGFKNPESYLPDGVWPDENLTSKSRSHSVNHLPGWSRHVA